MIARTCTEAERGAFFNERQGARGKGQGARGKGQGARGKDKRKLAMITFWISVIRGKGQGAKGQGNWQHYLVKDPDAPVYKDNLLRAVVSYNSSHI